MGSPRIVILCVNPVARDPRVRREAESLARHGFAVSYLYPAVDSVRRQGVLESGVLFEAIPFHPRAAPLRLASQARRFGIAEELTAAYGEIFLADPRLTVRGGDVAAAMIPMRLYQRLRIPLKYAQAAAHFGEAALRFAARGFKRAPPGPATEPSVVQERRILQWQLNLGFHLVKRALELRPRAVMAIDAYMLPMAAAVSHMSGARVIYDAHEIFYAQEPEGARSRVWVDYWRTLEKLLLPRTATRFAVSAGVGEHLQREMQSGSFVTLYNAPRLEIPEAAESRSGPNAPLRAEFHGGLLAGRGLEMLVDSGRFLRHGALTIYGEGPLGATLERRIAALADEPKVQLAHHIPYDRLLETLATNDLCILCYPDDCLNNHVSLPNKFFEGIMAGLPLLVPERPESAALVRQHELGVVLAEESAEGIAAAIDDLAERPAEWRRLHANALCAVREHFNWEREEPKLLAAFADL